MHHPSFVYAGNISQAHAREWITNIATYHLRLSFIVIAYTILPSGMSLGEHLYTGHTYITYKSSLSRQ